MRDRRANRFHKPGFDRMIGLYHAGQKFAHAFGRRRDALAVFGAHPLAELVDWVKGPARQRPDLDWPPRLPLRSEWLCDQGVATRSIAAGTVAISYRSGSATRNRSRRSTRSLARDKPALAPFGVFDRAFQSGLEAPTKLSNPLEHFADRIESRLDREKIALRFIASEIGVRNHSDLHVFVTRRQRVEGRMVEICDAVRLPP